MASRGRGRGRGRGGGANYATQVPFVLFPEDVNLPDVKLDDIDANMKKLLNWNYKFQNYWKASPYLLEETTLKKESQKMHVPRFSDKKRTVFTRDSLSQVLMLNDFPKELIQGTSKRMPSRKKFRWNPELEMKKIDFFEQLEKKDQKYTLELALEPIIPNFRFGIAPKVMILIPINISKKLRYN
ncbi:uncharacterized protein LOC133283648 isoform X2 [Gastrolobium bilobum]|uniref:uncharacterized protein LOC133283648 isoform X2 n=1 Tax=Gastrolobium bilobum TaxID=150636 RepID=UPI002AB15930|nr:uncharacterized protein LOC133283648 isoform X2 [Gastrolobium bilobum]